jgi:plastocyanin
MAAVATVLLLVAAPGGAGAKAKAPAVTCHWVKATKKHRRHKVCVRAKAKAKAKAKTKTTKKPATTPSTPAAAVATPAPAATTPVAAADPVAPVTLAPDPAAPAPVADPGPTALAHVQTTAREWSLTLSRPAIAAGAVSLQLVNAGEDAHDLHVRPASGGADVLSATSTEPGDNTTISGALPAGTYTLYCSLPGHEAAGMHATLTVTG